MGVASSGAGHEFQPGEAQLLVESVCFSQFRLVKFRLISQCRLVSLLSV